MRHFKNDYIYQMKDARLFIRIEKDKKEKLKKISKNYSKIILPLVDKLLRKEDDDFIREYIIK